MFASSKPERQLTALRRGLDVEATVVAVLAFVTVRADIQLIIVVAVRSEEHTSELQSLMRISYAVFCLKKKKNKSILQNPKLHYISNNNNKRSNKNNKLQTNKI